MLYRFILSGLVIFPLLSSCSQAFAKEAKLHPYDDASRYPSLLYLQGSAAGGNSTA